MYDLSRKYILENIDLLREKNFTQFFEKVPYEIIEDVVEYLDNKKIDYIEYIPVIYDGMYCARSFHHFEIPDNIIEIGRQAFSASHIQKIKIPENVEEVWNSFTNCRMLQEIEIESPSTLIAIGAFQGSLKNLRKLTIPKDAWADIEWKLFSDDIEDVDLISVEIIYT